MQFHKAIRNTKSTLTLALVAVPVLRVAPLVQYPKNNLRMKLGLGVFCDIPSPYF
jgi:hypothetical protein